MTHIAFVKPPWTMHEDTKQRPTGKFFNFISKILKDNSLPILVSYLRKQGYQVSLHHLKRPEEVSDIKADVYCFSLCSVDIPKFIETRQFINKAPVIVGGPHPSFDKSLLNYCDSIVVGEGETGLLKALSDLENRRLKKTYREPFIENLDILPFPAWDITDKPRYLSIITSSRGCPFHCTFCVTSKLYGRRWRAMSPKHIIQEILTERGEFVAFQDDNFTLSTKRVWEFLRLKREFGLNFKWFCFSRTDTIAKNPKLFEAMADEGCALIYLGIESACDEVLNWLNKGTTNKANRVAVETLHDCGIGIWTSTMVGPRDSERTARKLEDFCIWAEPIFHCTSICTPFVGTDLYYDLESKHRLLHKDWSFYDGAHCVFQPYRLSPRQVEDISLQIDEAVWGTIGWHRKLLNFPLLFRKPYWNLMKTFARFIRI